MFLDDELLQICKNYDCTIPENIQKLNIDLKTKCEEYYKARITPNMTDIELKVILDRVFNLWDSFVKMLLKDKVLTVLGHLFKEHSFKKEFLSNEKLNEVYQKLGK